MRQHPARRSTSPCQWAGTLTEPDQTVFVVDDDEAVRDAIATLLEAEGAACETYADAGAFLRAVAHWPSARGGCLVLDVRMPGQSGLDLQHELKVRGLDLPIIFVTGYGDVPNAVRAMKGGAVDFLGKPFSVPVLSRRIGEALRMDARKRQAERELAVVRARAAALSPRERQVLDRVSVGEANKVIAMELGISERTVEIHRSHVMKKMGVRNLASLVRVKLALDQGGMDSTR